MVDPEAAEVAATMQQRFGVIGITAAIWRRKAVSTPAIVRDFAWSAMSVNPYKFATATGGSADSLLG